MASDYVEVFTKIKALPIPDKWRLAASLFEQGKQDTAERIAQLAVDESTALRLTGGTDDHG